MGLNSEGGGTSAAANLTVEMAEKEVAALTDIQLRERLGTYQDSVPPITESTRKALERRLVKLMGTSKQPTPPVAGKPIPVVVSKPNPISQPVRATVKRTPSPTIAPLPRTLKPAAVPTPRRSPRSGAAFSSDEDEDAVDSSKKRGLPADATGGTPMRGNLNGRFFGSSKAGPSASTDLSSSSNSGSKLSGLSGWFNRSSRQEAPNTSTPLDRRHGYSVQDSFGAVTPIRNRDVLAGEVRPRSVLGRPSLSSFGGGPLNISDSPSPPPPRKWGVFSRLLGEDPIHLTPQTTSRDRTPHTHHSPPRPRPLRFNSNSIREEGNWFSRHSSGLLALAFLLFFLGAGGAYVRMRYGTSDVETTIVRYRLNGASEADNLHQCVEDQDPNSPGGPVCYKPEEIIDSLDMAAALSKYLAQKKGQVECEGTGDSRVKVADARSFAVDAVPKGSLRDFTRAVHLIVSNAHWGIRALDRESKPAAAKEDVFYLESDYASKGFICRMKEAVATLLFKIALAVLGATLLAGFIVAAYRFFERRTKRQDEVYEMVNQIIGTVKQDYESAKKSGKEPTGSVLNHIRDAILPHGPERKRILSVWDDAVAYVNTHESRIGLQQKQVQGEDFEVWNWLQPESPSQDSSSAEQTVPDSPVGKSTRSAAASTSSAVNGSGRGRLTRARLWGGGPIPAQSIMPENITAATPCLKVRGMFNGVEENQKDVAVWSAEVTEAILERCHNVARILDVEVEPTSDEGIVYVKLATNEDARNAYMALHGQYFDGRHVTVKFLKLDRYHQRFPDAIKKNVPLVASKRW
ncbi:putative Inner nuclear membrane protein Man1 [Hypsibius exemplaris]|uniref:Inner nuclear membrane protein Man1 n=1 Tax=Hypsibius exemplaris TaxID=2072580 RepID=A0A1W0XAC1_HYPEX|nr:putative Inner nuclear membrane protein Man1 [Hypsibius exemplaris]